MFVKLSIIVLALFVVCVQTDDIYECTVDYSHAQMMMTAWRGCSHYGGSFYCDHPYECCDNACCLKSEYNFRYTSAEIAGLFLASTSLFLLLGLSLLIFCGTYFNTNKDESFLLRRVGIR